MFLVPTTKKIQTLKYDPSVFNDNKDSDEYESQQQEALAFIQQIFCNYDLTLEEALSPDCSHLLNLINILFPCGFNEIKKTSDVEQLQEENLKEYLSQLKSINYRVENFPKEEYLQSKEVGINKVVSTILHLKSEYEQNGIQRKEKENDLRIFYLENKSLEDLKSTQVYGLNPFLTNQKNHQKFQGIQKMKIRNIFYLKEKNQLNFLIKRSEQLGYPLKNDSSLDSSEKEIKSSSESANGGAFDFGSGSNSEFESDKKNQKKNKNKSNKGKRNKDQKNKKNTQDNWDQVNISQISEEEQKENKSSLNGSQTNLSEKNEGNNSNEEEWANQSFSDPSISDFSLGSNGNEKDFLNERNEGDETVSDSSHSRSSDFDFNWLSKNQNNDSKNNKNRKNNKEKNFSSKEKDHWPNFGETTQPKKHKI